ncbi:hypothetical protein ACIO13_13130 [Streptomyces sp. NPDC087425]|uniref:hypothetical protein n=1 Tax=unclassified Streptomyces TaxID=2593676 RepID=UPI0037F7E759
MESLEPPEPLEDEVRPDDEEEDDEELSVVDCELSSDDVELSVVVDELSVDFTLLLVVVDDAWVSVCIVPMRANIPAAAARVIAAAVAAVRRAPLRTAAAAPRSLLVIAVPLRSDVVSRPTVGERPERSL